MKTVAILIFLLPVALGWDYPGYPGVDCPTARAKMPLDPENQWILPKCNEDGTYQDMQCYDQYPDIKDTCMCTAPDGSPLTLPGFGLDVKSCVCFLAVYDAYLKNPDADFPKCENSGFYSPLQCNESTKECWCVDKNGKVLVPPSTKVHSCDDPILKLLK